MAVEVGSIVEGKITGVKKFGAFVALPGGQTGMVHTVSYTHLDVYKRQPYGQRRRRAGTAAV